MTFSQESEGPSPEVESLFNEPFHKAKKEAHSLELEQAEQAKEEAEQAYKAFDLAGKIPPRFSQGEMVTHTRRNGEKNLYKIIFVKKTGYFLQTISGEEQGGFIRREPIELEQKIPVRVGDRVVLDEKEYRVKEIEGKLGAIVETPDGLEEKRVLLTLVEQAIRETIQRSFDLLKDLETKRLALDDMKSEFAIRALKDK